MVRISTDNDKIFAAVREVELNDGSLNTVLGFFNFSAEKQEVTINADEYAGSYTCTCGMPVEVGEEDHIILKPWEWLIYCR